MAETPRMNSIILLGQARGSLSELETQIEIAINLHFWDKEVASRLLSKAGEIGRMLTGLRAWSRKTGGNG